MADRRLFVWQRSLLIAITSVSVCCVCIASFNLSAARSPNRKIAKQTTVPRLQQPLSSDTSQVKTLIAQQNLAFKKAVARCVEEEKARQHLVPVQFQGKTINDVKLKGEQKTIRQQKAPQPIALTFDDGPWSNTTSQVLNILNKYNAKATFFVVGKQVQTYPQLAKQIVNQGHAIANHTWSHEYNQYSRAAAAREIDRTAEILYKTTGIKTSLFRPPAGILDNGLVAYAHQKKYAVVMWSVDSKDWRLRRNTKQAFIKNLLKEAKPGGIVLLHDGGGDRSKTVQALPQLITELKKRGYEFVTVPELLRRVEG